MTLSAILVTLWVNTELTNSCHTDSTNQYTNSWIWHAVQRRCWGRETADCFNDLRGRRLEKNLKRKTPPALQQQNKIEKFAASDEQTGFCAARLRFWCGRRKKVFPFVSLLFLIYMSIPLPPPVLHKTDGSSFPVRATAERPAAALWVSPSLQRRRGRMGRMTLFLFILKHAFVVVFLPSETHVLAQPTLQPAESSPFLLQRVVFSPDAPKICPLSPLNASFYYEH